MDVAALATNLAQNQTMQAVQIAALKKILDTQRTAGHAAVALIQAAAQIGANAPGTSGVAGLGACVDCTG